MPGLVKIWKNRQQSDMQSDRELFQNKKANQSAIDNVQGFEYQGFSVCRRVLHSYSTNFNCFISLIASYQELQK